MDSRPLGFVELVERKNYKRVTWIVGPWGLWSLGKAGKKNFRIEVSSITLFLGLPFAIGLFFMLSF